VKFSTITFVLIGIFVAFAISLPLFLISNELKSLNKNLGSTTEKVDNLSKKLGDSSLLKF
jgi:cell division protein FtsL